MAKAKSWFDFNAGADGSAEISIFGEIGGYGVSAASFKEQLTALGGVSEIRLSINSAGGDIPTGFAIYNMLNRHPANKVVTIEGLAASMASVIAAAGNEVVMPSNAMLMIHNPWGSVVGGVEEIQSFGNALKIMQDNIARAYKDRTGLALPVIRGMMDRETWLSAKDAVSKGFADTIEKPVALDAKAFNLTRFINVPASFGQTKEKTAMGKAKVEGEENGEAEIAVKTEAEIRTELLASQNEIRALCKLSGFEALAEGFITANKTRAEVMTALEAKREEDAKAKAEAEKKRGKKTSGQGGEVSAHNNPRNNGEPVAEIDTAKIFARFNSAGKRNAA